MVGVLVAVGRGRPSSPASTTAGLTGTPALHSFGCTDSPVNTFTPTSRRPNIEVAQAGRGPDPEGPPGTVPRSSRCATEGSELHLDPLSHPLGNRKLGAGEDWLPGPTESHGRARFRNGVPASAQSREKHLYSLTLGPLDGELASPRLASGRPESTIHSRGDARGRGPSRPDVRAAQGGEGDAPRTPFTGSQAETRGTRWDTRDEAVLADLSP